MSGRRVWLSRADGSGRLALAEQLGDSLHIRFESGVESCVGLRERTACVVHDYRLDRVQTERMLAQFARDFGPGRSPVWILKTEFESRRFDDSLHDYLRFHRIPHEFHCYSDGFS